MQESASGSALMNAKKRPTRGKANLYMKATRKARRKLAKLLKLTPEELKAKIDEDIKKIDLLMTDMKAKAAKADAELPKLRSQRHRLERELRKRRLEIARLAAQIHPELCETNPDEAIKLAITLLQASERALSEDPKKDGEKKARTRTEILDEVAALSLPYERWVRFVTKKKKWSLALARLKEFLEWEASRRGEKDVETWVEAWMGAYRNKERPGDWLLKLRQDIGIWWKQEKPKRAKKGGEARAKIRWCPECPKGKKRRLEPGKQLCRYHAKRAKVTPVGYLKGSTDIANTSDSVQANSGKTPKRGGEY